jgi:hypothetical protein
LSEGEETLLFDMLREMLGTPAEDREAYEARWAHRS